MRGWGLVLAGVFLGILMTACSSGGGSGGSPENIGIVSQPTDQTVVAGDDVNFSVQVSGEVSGYQWQTSSDGAITWNDIAGATQAAYTRAAVDVSLSGRQYRVQVSGAGGPIYSSAVTLTVSEPAPVSISVQPAAQTVVAGQDASFSVTASGTAIQYQWQSSADGRTWGAISGAHAATLVVNAVAFADGGKQYRVVVSNSLSAVTSAAAGLTVHAAPAAAQITTQPASASVTAGATATFAVVATGTPAPTYQWQRSSNGGSSFSDLSGATSPSYTTPATATADSGTQFRVVVSNTSASVTSQAVTLNVAAAPVAPSFTTQPAAASVTAPAGATFTATASGTPTPTYQWQLSTDGGISFTNINGATGASYTLASTTVANNGQRYRVVATNAAGTTTSNGATLTVAAAPSAVVSSHRLSTTYGHTLAVRADGSVLAWGSNMSGGSGTALGGSAAVVVSGAGSAAAAYAFEDTGNGIGNESVVIQSSGAVQGWGSTSIVGSGLGVYKVASSAQLVSASPFTISQLSGIRDLRLLPNGVTLALKADGTLWLLGGTITYDVVTRIGTVQALQVAGVGAIAALGDAISAGPTAAGIRQAKVPLVDSSGAAKLLTVASTGGSTPVSSGTSLVYTATYSVAAITGLPTVSKVTCSGTFIQWHCLALATDRTVWSWGTIGTHGEMGDGTDVAKTTPFRVAGLASIQDVAATNFASFALTESGSVYSWGNGADIGRAVVTYVGLGDGTPALVTGVSGVAEITVSGADDSGLGIYQRVLVRTGSGAVWGWGDNGRGELGDGTTAFASRPVQAVGVHLN
ncbi:hypothetical protein CATMQ487_43130 [Sphaerotilus microaerophilus]|uniref:Immunoglobulin domain-containing protein n=1 Tax=Sphaerotilus microaerophilus TaxID=2914710 RepID=A0ABN6PRU8_9BURK|nr:hypothetical protein CATMQ487_43130 [Sphaerotilus sp. FB-5]